LVVVAVVDDVTVKEAVAFEVAKSPCAAKVAVSVYFPTGNVLAASLHDAVPPLPTLTDAHEDGRVPALVVKATFPVRAGSPGTGLFSTTVAVIAALASLPSGSVAGVAVRVVVVAQVLAV